jgi:hypothetical protein
VKRLRETLFGGQSGSTKAHKERGRLAHQSWRMVILLLNHLPDSKKNPFGNHLLAPARRQAPAGSQESAREDLSRQPDIWPSLAARVRVGARKPGGW